MNKMIRRANPTEHQIQSAIIEWASITIIPNTRLRISDCLVKITNEGTASIVRGVKSKKEGLLKGVSDLFFAKPMKVGEKSLWYGQMYCGMWIEVKSKKGKLTKEQERWISTMSIAGYETKVVKSVEEGIQAIKDYLGLK